MGLTRGGTRIEISGAWFDFKPEYGIVPHMRLGDKITRCIFSSTVRIVCPSPPNEAIGAKYPVEVSLNGYSFIDSGFTFQYFEQPKLNFISPTSGPDAGGTLVHINGAKFSNMSDPQTFKCRFQPYEDDAIAGPKFMPAVYENSTSIMCSTPTGWGVGRPVQV